MNKIFTEFKENLKKLKFKDGDIIFLVSDMTKLLINNREISPDYTLNSILDALLDVVGNNGTILLPTYNFDFCKGITYDYLNTPSRSGALGKAALKRKDFVRTTNPIYSFAVAGKDKNKLYNLKHSSCFGNDSPFYYLHKNNSKYFSIGIDIKDSGFTPGHYIEEKVRVSYRYFKDFTGKYIDKNKTEKIVKYKFYVKDRSKSVRTGISVKFDKLLIEINAYAKHVINNEFYNIMNLNRVIDFLIKDMKTKPEDERILYPERSGVFKRDKINTIRSL